MSSPPPTNESVQLTRRGRVIVFLVILALVIGLPLLGGYIYLRSIGLYGPGDPGPRVELVVPEGSSARGIGELLEKNEVIESALSFRIAVFLRGGNEVIQAGRYELATGLTAPDALSLMLDEGPVLEFVAVTFPEGSWLTDFARRLDEETHLSEDRFLKLATSAGARSKLLPPGVDTLEGLLFPSTYQIVDKDSERSVLKRLVAEMEEQAGDASIEARAAELGISPYEAVIIASMIEGEASAAGDRNKIAAVIYNRLEEGMRLEIDATVLYALGEHKESLTRSDLDVDSPYNTRLYAGLPPTPIGAPGAASLAAAVDPADGNWLYYVLADCEGHHHFTDDYQEFLEHKSAYQALDC